jgi:GT2 family glycosyltransferase
MKLSVILPCFNAADTIALQLDALTRQAWPAESELIVCNNGSTDGSMEVVERYRALLPNLRILDVYEGRGPRRGVARSYALGFAAAKGEVFLLCEADDEVGEGWLATLLGALEQHELVAAALDYDRLNAEHIRPKEWQQQSKKEGLSINSGPTFWPYASGCSLGLRRSVYERVGDPDEACAASWDTDYCWRAKQAGIVLTFVPEATLHYRMRTSAGAAFKQGKSWAHGHVVLDRKYAPVRSRLGMLKKEARALRDLAKQLGRGVEVVTGKQTVEGWLWGVGWCVGIVEAAPDNLRRAERERVQSR